MSSNGTNGQYNATEIRRRGRQPSRGMTSRRELTPMEKQNRDSMADKADQYKKLRKDM